MGTETNLQEQPSLPAVDQGMAVHNDDSNNGNETLQHQTKLDGLAQPQERGVAFKHPLFLATPSKVLVDIVEQALVAFDLASPAGDVSEVNYFIKEDGALRLVLPEELEKRRKQLFNLEVVHASGEVCNKMLELYWFNKLQKDQRESYVKGKRNRQLAATALETATRMIDMLTSIHKGYTDQELYFTQSQMKSMLHQLKRNISNSQLWEMIELLRMFNYLSEDPSTVTMPKHKKLFHIALLPTEQLTALDLELQGYRQAIESSKVAVKDIQGKIKNIQQKIKRNAKRTPTTANYESGRGNEAEQVPSRDTELEGVHTSEADADGTLEPVQSDAN